jgi:hypothetical protein
MQADLPERNEIRVFAGGTPEIGGATWVCSIFSRLRTLMLMGWEHSSAAEVAGKAVSRYHRAVLYLSCSLATAPGRPRMP